MSSTPTIGMLRSPVVSSPRHPDTVTLRPSISSMPVTWPCRDGGLKLGARQRHAVPSPATQRPQRRLAGSSGSSTEPTGPPGEGDDGCDRSRSTAGNRVTSAQTKLGEGGPSAAIMPSCHVEARPPARGWSRAVAGDVALCKDRAQSRLMSHPLRVKRPGSPLCRSVDITGIAGRQAGAKRGRSREPGGSRRWSRALPRRDRSRGTGRQAPATRSGWSSCVGTLSSRTRPCGVPKLGTSSASGSRRTELVSTCWSRTPGRPHYRDVSSSRCWCPAAQHTWWMTENRGRADDEEASAQARQRLGQMLATWVRLVPL